MKTIQVFYSKQPCLNVDEGFGLNRDRNPDSGWGEVRSTNMSLSKTVVLTPELRQTLLEDLAYVYGQNTKIFSEKLKEFEFI